MATVGKRKKGLSLADMRQVLVNGKIGKNGILLRPSHGYSFLELEHDRVVKAFDEIAMKVSIVECGLDTFSECEKVLFQILTTCAG